MGHIISLNAFLNKTAQSHFSDCLYIRNHTCTSAHEHVILFFRICKVLSESTSNEFEHKPRNTNICGCWTCGWKKKKLLTLSSEDSLTHISYISPIHCKMSTTVIQSNSSGVNWSNKLLLSKEDGEHVKFTVKQLMNEKWCFRTEKEKNWNASKYQKNRIYIYGSNPTHKWTTTQLADTNLMTNIHLPPHKWTWLQQASETGSLVFGA